jgi:hypothetical protein
MKDEAARSLATVSDFRLSPRYIGLGRDFGVHLPQKRQNNVLGSDIAVAPDSSL